MSVRMMGLVWPLELPTTEKFVLLALANHHSDRTGQCNPDQATLARECGIGKRQVIRMLASLEERGLVSRSRASRTDRNNYILHLSEVTAEAPRPGDTSDTSQVTSRTPREVTQTTPREVTFGTSRGDIHDTLRGDICDTSLYRKNQEREPEENLFAAEEPAAPEKAQKPKPKKSAEKPAEEPAKRDELFEAVAEVCCLDWKAQGSLIGKAKQKLLGFREPATAEEVRLFGQVYAAQHPFKQVPKWTELVEQFGIVRNPERVKRILSAQPGQRGPGRQESPDHSASYEDAIPWQD